MKSEINPYPIQKQLLSNSSLLPIQIPKKIFFDPTNQCNLRCIHCYNESGLKKPHEISIEGIEKIAREMAKIGIRDVSIAGGEPFIRKDIFQILDVFKRHQIRMSMTTNGLLLSRHKILQLHEYELENLTVSIDGITHEDYQLYRASSQFELLLKRLLDLKDYYPWPKSMRMSVMKGNCIPKKVLDFADQYGFNFLKINKAHILGRFALHKEYEINDREYDEKIEIFRRLKDGYQCKIELPREKYMNQKTPLRCSAGKKTAYVSSEGKLYACSFCDNKFYFGDLKKEGLYDLLQSNQQFTVDNPYCLACPAMKKSHNITKSKI